MKNAWKSWRFRLRSCCMTEGQFPTPSVQVSIVGGSGYTGGELLRLLLTHPNATVRQATSRSHLGEYLYQVHPNLRKRTQLKFTDPGQLEPVDVLFLALPHGQAQLDIQRYAALADKIIDLSADFRLRDAALYQKWYGKPHAAPEWLEQFVYGLPELHRAEIGTAEYLGGVGCNATACNLALLPLVKADLVDRAAPVLSEIKVGSSEGGAEGNPGSHHPERSSVIRTFSAFGHRHTAEVIQEMGLANISLTMTSVAWSTGVLATLHATVREGVASKIYGRPTARQPVTIRSSGLSKNERGIYRVPEAKILAGSNYADLGFELDEASGHIVSMCAIDNLMKGTRGPRSSA